LQSTAGIIQQAYNNTKERAELQRAKFPGKSTTGSPRLMILKAQQQLAPALHPLKGAISLSTKQLARKLQVQL